MSTGTWGHESGSRELDGMAVEALDGSVGKVDRLIEREGGEYLVVDTGPWIFGKTVMLPVTAIAAVDAERDVVSVRLTKAQIKDAPEPEVLATDAAPDLDSAEQATDLERPGDAPGLETLDLETPGQPPSFETPGLERPDEAPGAETPAQAPGLAGPSEAPGHDHPPTFEPPDLETAGQAPRFETPERETVEVGTPSHTALGHDEGGPASTDRPHGLPAPDETAPEPPAEQGRPDAEAGGRPITARATKDQPGGLEAPSDAIVEPSRPAPAAKPSTGTADEADRGAKPAGRKRTTDKRRATQRSMPIAGYESLTAAEVIERLRKLTQKELAQVERHERSHENRQTVIGRIESLREEQPWRGYDGQTVNEVRKTLAKRDADRVRDVRDYERRHRDRAGIVEAARRILDKA
jgi:hypothetical protein